MMPIKLPPAAIEAAARAYYAETCRLMRMASNDPTLVDWEHLPEAAREQRAKAMAIGISEFLRCWI